MANLVNDLIVRSHAHPLETENQQATVTAEQQNE